jgi:NAD(P)-dependent dehydrogenase (short-subunit alcohol dehydrogenase family)
MERRTVIMGMGIGALSAAAGAVSETALAAEGKLSDAKNRIPNTNKVAVISGVSSGIGYGTALILVERGINVIGTYKSNQPGALKLVEEAKQRGTGKVIPFHLDLNFMDSITKFRADAVAALQDGWKTDKFDYLVNNAGTARTAKFGETPEATFDELMRVLLKGPYFLTQEFLPYLKDGGSIVNVTSNAALPTSIAPGYSVYGTMKGGLGVLTRYMAKELGERKIRVNGVSPGPTRTRLGNGGLVSHPETIPALAQQTVLSRIGEPADIGRVIASLLSDELGWITGENIETSGGFRM